MPNPEGWSGLGEASPGESLRATARSGPRSRCARGPSVARMHVALGLALRTARSSSPRLRDYLLRNGVLHAVLAETPQGDALSQALLGDLELAVTRLERLGAEAVECVRADLAAGAILRPGRRPAPLATLVDRHGHRLDGTEPMALLQRALESGDADLVEQARGWLRRFGAGDVTLAPLREPEAPRLSPIRTVAAGADCLAGLANKPLVLVGRRDQLALLDLRTGGLARVASLSLGNLTSIAWSAGESLAVVGTEDGRVAFVAYRDFVVQRVVPLGSCPVVALHVEADSGRVVALLEGGLAFALDADGSRPIPRSSDDRPVRSASWASTDAGPVLALGLESGRLVVLDAVSLAPLHEYDVVEELGDTDGEDDPALVAIAWSNEARGFIVAYGSTLALRRLGADPANELARIFRHDQVSAMATARGGRMALVGSLAGSIRVARMHRSDTSATTRLGSVPVQALIDVPALGQVVALVEGRLHMLDHGELHAALERPNRATSPRVVSFDVSRDGAEVVVGNASRSFAFLRIEDGSEVDSLIGSYWACGPAVLDRDERAVLCGQGAEIVPFRRTDEGDFDQSDVSCDGRSPPDGFAYRCVARSGGHLVWGTDEGALVFVDDEGCIATIEGAHEGVVRFVGLDAGARVAFSVDEHGIAKRWDVRTRTATGIVAFAGHPTALAVAPTGSVAHCAVGGLLHLWEGASPRVVSHAKGARVVACSPSGARWAYSNGSRVVLVDAATSEAIATWWSYDEVHAVAVPRDDRVFVGTECEGVIVLAVTPKPQVLAAT
jgi:hypothetical protein